MHLDALCLRHTDIDDEHIKLILGALPQLRTLELAVCRKLTYRVPPWFPLELDVLDISHSPILTSPPGAEGLENFQYFSLEPTQFKVAKHLILSCRHGTQIEPLLQIYAMAS